MDWLQVLTALAAVISKVDLGISVLQLPLRNPVEHRVQSLQAMSNNRLILGVGSGSTRDDFELLGYDYDLRFRTFRSDLEIMKKVWQGEPVNGGTLATWPGCEGGPPSPIGVWRSPRWITHAAKQAQGWTPLTTPSPRYERAAGAPLQSEPTYSSRPKSKSSPARWQEFGAIDILVNAVGGSTIIPHPGATMDQLTLARP